MSRKTLPRPGKNIHKSEPPMYPPEPNNQKNDTPEELPPQERLDTPPVYYPPPSQAPPWQPPPNQTPGYPVAQGYAYPVPVNGTTILLLGILSIVLCSFCGPVAWVMGNNALAAIDSGQADPTQRSNVVAGRICGIIGTVLIGLGILWMAFWLILIGIGAASSGGSSS